MNSLILSVVIQLFFAENFANEDLVVSLRDGLVKGTYRESYNGRKFIAFEGIPFARPPVGNLRFEDPQPVEPWTGVLEAVNTYMCLQFAMIEEVSGQEDCLYINVYVPRDKINSDEKLDVIAHVHGSGFMTESPDIAGPIKIMDRDVIYVNFNYRLGPFGFYSLGDGRGNYGLKDQTVALQWIRDNIDKFGGNKDSVTLNGLSAGGASVHLHYFSDLSKGLFHRAFSQSGMALNPWVVRDNPAVFGKKLAVEVGCSDQSVEDMYECMKQRSGQQIAKAVQSLCRAPLIPLAFGPVVEKNSPSSFLKKHPYAQLVDKEITDVPFLISMTSEEGTIPAIIVYRMVDEVNNNWKQWLPLMLEYYQYDQEKQDDISQKIKEFYFHNDPITTENFHLLIKACSHRMFHLGGETAARLQANAIQSNVYFFLLEYAGDFTPETNVNGLDVDFGAGHGIDMKFMYSGPYYGPLSKNEERIKDILLDIMVSFAKTGNPNIDGIDFQPVSNSEEFNYLRIKSPDDLHMEASSLGPHEFWRSLGLEEDTISA